MLSPKLQKKLDTVTKIDKLRNTDNHGLTLSHMCDTCDITISKYWAMRNELMTRGLLTDANPKKEPLDDLKFGAEEKASAIVMVNPEVFEQLKSEQETYEEVDALIDSILDQTDDQEVVNAVVDTLNDWIERIAPLLGSDNDAARMTGELVDRCLTDFKTAIHGEDQEEAEEEAA